jgi:hypothetical protein
MPPLRDGTRECGGCILLELIAGSAQTIACEVRHRRKGIEDRGG